MNLEMDHAHWLEERAHIEERFCGNAGAFLQLLAGSEPA